MARRNRTESDTDTIENEEISVTVTEELPTEVSEEAVEVAVEDEVTEAPVEAKAPEVEVDLTAFNEAVATAIENHDNATGTVPEAFLPPVTEAYRALDGLKAKNQAKKSIEEAMREGMASMNIGLARAYMVISDNLTAGAAPKPERVPADPTEALVQKVAGLELARLLVEVPENVQSDWESKVGELIDTSRDQAREFLAWFSSDAEDKGDEPEVPSWVKAAVKLSLGKSAKVSGKTGGAAASREYSGVRHDIGKHIAEAFDSVESGEFLSIAQIRAFKSDEYGDATPSAGAISARLFPKTGSCTLEFVTPDTSGEADAGKPGNKGARKV